MKSQKPCSTGQYLNTTAISSVSGQHHDHTTKQIGVHLFFFISINLFCSNTTYYLYRGETLVRKCCPANGLKRSWMCGFVECWICNNTKHCWYSNFQEINEKWVKSVPSEKCENQGHIYVLIYILQIKAICT